MLKINLLTANVYIDTDDWVQKKDRLKDNRSIHKFSCKFAY